MTTDQKIVVKTDRGGSGFGLVWIMGWLFTIGFLHLSLPKGLYAIVLWPYYLGLTFARP